MTDVDVQADLYGIQSAIASANAELAAALSRSARFVDPHLEISALADTHDELVDAYGKLIRAIKATEKLMTDLDADYGNPTPREIVDDHGDRFRER